jgi:hypothetical protein
MIKIMLLIYLKKINFNLKKKKQIKNYYTNHQNFIKKFCQQFYFG